MQLTEVRNDLFMTRKDAAQFLNVSSRTVNRWINSGVIKVWRTAGGHSRIYRSSVEALADGSDGSEPVADLQTILVVEDDPEMREFVSVYLQSLQLPVRVITASNGYDGLMLIGKESPELIITDLRMPGMDGVEMIRSMRKSPVMGDTRVVAMTVLNAEEIRDLGGLPDDVRLLRKPLNTTQLAEVILACFWPEPHTHANPGRQTV